MTWEHRARVPNLDFECQGRFLGGGIFLAKVTRVHRSKLGVKGFVQLQRPSEGLQERHKPEERVSCPRNAGAEGR